MAEAEEEDNLQISLLFDDPPEHVQPIYTEQDELHPSPFTLFPSSHANTYFLPSPHVYKQLVYNNYRIGG